MDNQKITAAIQAFERDLENSVCMKDRRSAVWYLAQRLQWNRVAANQIAEVYGYKSSYYKA